MVKLGKRRVVFEGRLNVFSPVLGIPFDALQGVVSEARPRIPSCRHRGSKEKENYRSGTYLSSVTRERIAGPRRAGGRRMRGGMAAGDEQAVEKETNTGPKQLLKPPYDTVG